MKILIKSVNHTTASLVLVRACIYNVSGEALSEKNERTHTYTELCSSDAPSEIRELVCMCDLLDEMPEAGRWIDVEELEHLESVSKLTQAVRKGLNILSYGANSPHALKVKLVKRGFDPQVALKAVEYLTDNSYIRVENDAIRMAERCIRKHWGLSRILAYLKSRGFDDQTVFGVEEYYSDVDFSENCAELIRKNYPTLPTELRDKSKMIASLTGYGYSIIEIKQAIRLVAKG